MSTTYSLVCDECKVTYWCGQSDYLYDDKETCNFLHQHCGHKIRFVNDLVDDNSTDGYEDHKQGVK
jgi:hypothetical protein